MSLLEVKNFGLEFKTESGVFHAVKNISFSLESGKVMGLVGESGSGKSVTSLAIMRLLETPPARFNSGDIVFEGKSLLEKSEKEMRQLRGNDISMIFQEPMTSLNPVFRVGDQIAEALQLHKGLSKKEASDLAVDWMDKVGIPNPSSKANNYPHELSGGQKQRIMIAMAMCCDPKLLIADEPTTALDVTIQKQVLELMLSLQESYQMSLLFISHDLSVISDISDEICVMYKGEIVEQGSTSQIMTSPKHGYTKGLMACRPRKKNNPSRLPTIERFINNDSVQTLETREQEKQRKREALSEEIILEVKGLKTYFPVRTGILSRTKEFIKAVDGVDLKIKKGTSFGLVGESGCGKTTLGRTLIRLVAPTEGSVLFQGQDVARLEGKELKAMRKKMQMIFQDPFSSLNPRMTVEQIVSEPMIVHRLYSDRHTMRKETQDLLDRVGLLPEHLQRYPHEFSGGQRQRISIARALSLKPEFLICDESVSALDVSIQAQILNLLLDLQNEFDLTYIFISHDLGVVNFFADEVAVMNQGKIVEQGLAHEVYENPVQDYTKKLLGAIPGVRFPVQDLSAIE